MTKRGRPPSATENVKRPETTMTVRKNCLLSAATKPITLWQFSFNIPLVLLFPGKGEGKEGEEENCYAQNRARWGRSLDAPPLFDLLIIFTTAISRDWKHDFLPAINNKPPPRSGEGETKVVCGPLFLPPPRTMEADPEKRARIEGGGGSRHFCRRRGCKCEMTGCCSGLSKPCAVADLL